MTEFLGDAFKKDEYHFEKFEKTRGLRKHERLPILRRKLLGLGIEGIRKVRKTMEEGRSFETAMNMNGIYA